MGSVSITHAETGLDGVEFTATRDGVAQQFVLYRDGLEDLEFRLFESDEELMSAFARHRLHIARVAARAWDAARGGGRPIVLQSLML
jgi:hypothetical protein